MVRTNAAAPLPELGVIGWPLHQTFSPPMQNAALRHTGFDWNYEAIPVAPGDVPAFARRAAHAMRGFNITIPHKEAIARCCSVVDRLSALSGAVNTVVCATRGGNARLEGHNTDGPGLLKALEVRCGLQPSGGRALILGAGGAAAGCAGALAEAGVEEILLLNRTPERTQDLIARMRAAFPQTTWRHEISDPAAPCAAVLPGERFHLVVNCIPEEPASRLGPILQAVRCDGAVLCDMSYSDGPTALMETARDNGYAVVPGLEVLLWQGVYAFEIMTGVAAPAQVMRDAITGVVGDWWLKC